MEGIDIVYHAAALKIITTAELNPDDAIKTNIQGTQNVKNACIQNEVTSAVLISTDKAVKPVNLYGMTKAIAEKIWVATRPKPSCNFSVVRYGNVVGSRGSIVPFFKQLVTENKPIPITHADMTRFLITLDQAIELVFNATGSDGIIHVPIIPAAKVTDLVEAIAGPAYPTIKIGIRPGEKIHECLINEYEILITKQRGLSYLIGVKDPDHCLSDEFTSLTARKLSLEEIRGFL
jgi:UDP-N-acetylglucosamine 4,6-dehydratase